MKKLLAGIGLASLVMTAVVVPQAAYAKPGPDPTPITIDGTVTDKNGNTVAGRSIVIWCGDISHFGGQAVTDSLGHFILQTDSEKCPLGWLLSAVAYNLDDPFVIDGLALAYIHTQTTVNVQLGVHNTVPVPEYGLFGVAAAIIAGGSAIFFARRRFTVSSAL
ncbi:MAG TPA: hypothetical protein VFT87_02895 [Candidatus Saccharimonadales bacterium]|nr:hypothetical protein [Candidatus Saccharimonadales bacterium]